MSVPRLDDPREAREHAVRPLEWLPDLGCWCVYSADAIAAVLKSHDFAVADFDALHSKLERLGIDCGAAANVLAHVATAHDGEAHARLRRDSAGILNADIAATKQRTAAVVADIVHELCRPGARIDLVADIVRPACDALFANILGAAPSATGGTDVSASQIFDLYLGLNRRIRINTEVSRLLQGFTAAKDDLKSSPEYAAALSALGYDSIVGSLSCSLLAVLRQAGAETKLCEASFPPTLPATAVPYIERFARRDCALDGQTIHAGERVRLYLDDGGTDEERPFFGRGRHSCLGEELSTWLWKTLTAELGKLPLACTIERVARRSPDWVFVFYTSILVSFA
jgi:cytochrome P450